MGEKFCRKTRLYSPRSYASAPAANNSIYDRPNKLRHLRLWIGLLSAIGLNACATIMGTANAPDELARTWDGAIVAIPKKYYKSDVAQETPAIVARRMKDAAKDVAKIPAETRIPLVIYLHGCGGFGYTGRGDIYFLASEGYAVIAPDSFCRKYKPKSCESSTYVGGLHRDVLSFRLAEAKYAHEKAKTLPWVDERNIFMMGYSEGGLTTAQYDRGGLAGRIILGWTCNHPWPEHRGISGPRSEPILAVVASRDPWFIDYPSTWGHCGAYAFRRKIESIIVDASVHHVQGIPHIQKKILQFLEDNRHP